MTLAVMASSNAHAQQWVKYTIGPNEGTRAVVITADNTIYTFGYENEFFISSDNGLTWQQNTIPFNTGVVQKAVEFEGKVYLAATEGLFSYDGTTWSSENDYAFFSLTKNDNCLLAVGEKAFLLTTQWSELTSLESYLSNEYSYFAASAGAGDKFSVFLNQTSSSSSTTTAIISLDNGQTWNAQSDYTMVVTTDAAMKEDGSYSLVGIESGTSLIGSIYSCGEYGYNLMPGTLYSSIYFDGTYWTGGYYGDAFPSDPGALGVLLPNGDESLAFITDSPIEDLSANENTIVAIDRLGGVYIATTTVGIKEPTLSSLDIYPNPTTAGVYLSLKNQDLVRLYSSNGSLLKEQKMPAGNSYLDLSAYPMGIYFLKTGNGAQNKVVKQ